MPKNKQAYIRYRIIDASLRNKQKPFPTKEELIKACEVIGTISLRTIEQDLYDMQHDEELGYFAPIKYNKKEKGYHYEDPDYSISNIPLKENDLYALEFAVALLKQFEGIDTVAQFGEAVNKIEDYVNVRSLMGEQDMEQIIQLEQSTSRTGQQYLNLLLRAIKERKRVICIYKRFDAAIEKQYQFDPYVLKEYRNRWYVTGKTTTSEHPITFGLDRMLAVKETGDSFIMDPHFNASDYFKYSFGISVRNELQPEIIVLQFDKTQAEYIKSQPLHHTQQAVSTTENYSIFSIEVIPSFELKAQLLSYGKGVKVLTPEWLQKEMANEHQEALAQYH
ncbi:MAG: WYL domain-containing protein [Bacteroidia bacterium]|jgi:predicted DNA-binding transcriptional regulator YafY|nr:WYL domain-containing protein [Bacteroidia bacterium]